MPSEQTPGLAPINAETTVSVIARRLREAISSGVYAPGTRLTEQDIAEQLNVSRGPLREAIQRLVQEGIVTSIPNRGAFVKDLDNQGIADLYVARFACESAALRLLVANPDALQIDRLSELIDQLKNALKESDWQLAGELDLAFHEALVVAASNPHLIRMFDTLKVETMLCLARMGPQYPEEEMLADEHESLLRAIKSGDIDEAISELRGHMADGADRLSGVSLPI